MTWMFHLVIFHSMSGTLISIFEGFFYYYTLMNLLNRQLQKHERTGKKYGCFPFVWKTKIFK